MVRGLEQRVHVKITSRLENVELVQIAVQSALHQLQISEADADQIGTAVREAVANAIRHGNSLDADKSVQVELGVDGEEVVIEVRDEGVGFDPGSVPDPLQGDNLLRANGRGILLMQEFMDEIEYTFEPGRGTELRMRKRLSAPRPDSERQEEENR